MNAWFTPIDLYCERTGPEFWSEPLNALTNLLFVAAGLVGVWQVRARQTGAVAALLCWWVVAVGLGSFLFHTAANELTKWFDIVPIAIFTFALTLFNLRRFAALKWPKAAAYFVAYFVLIALVTANIPDWLRTATNGSVGYLPAWGAFVFAGVVVLAYGSPAGWYDFACALIFIPALFFRSIDQSICAAFPVGSHFLWHALNAVMLLVALMSVAKYGAPKRDYR